MSLHIIRLMAENIKRIKAVDITPNDNTVIISGKNEAGKSSILDAIWLAIQPAAASKDTPQPIRDGQNYASCVLDLGDFIVKKSFKYNSDKSKVIGKLSIETKDGNIVKSPQQLLDSFVGHLSFDPLAFINMTGKQRRQMVSDIAGINIQDFEARYSGLYDKRTELNREKKAISNILSSIAPPTMNESAEEESAQDLIKEVTDLKMAIVRRDTLKASIVAQEAEILKLEDKLAALKKDVAEARATLETDADFENVVARCRAKEHKLVSLEAVNSRAREIKKYNTCVKNMQEIQEKIDVVQVEMDKIADEKTTMLKSINLPVTNLEMSDDDVLFGGLPLSQLSSSEQIKISMALAMAANPKLRIVRIKDGSLLDKDNIKLIGDIAKDKDFQVWIECVDDSGSMGFYIEDGECINT